MRDAPAKSEARLLVVDDEPTILEFLLRGYLYGRVDAQLRTFSSFVSGW